MKLPIELIVFGAIAIFVIAASFAVIPANIPENKTRSLLPVLGKAPELAGIKGWINSEPLKIEELKGKVVLIDFWTYSCINCIRTLPYLKAWHEKYKDQGLVIIGVHTPEFEFEKDYTNVKSAVEKYGIKYAVAQDNDYATWRAYKNSYWPRKYLIDKDGNIRYDHIGEGGYEETEKAIMELLQETNTAMQANKNLTYISSDTELSRIGTPELYLGYDFARAPLGNPEGFSPESIVNYKETNITAPNIIYLSGSWKNERDKIIAVNNSRLFLVYKAKDVNIVAGGAGVVEIFIDSVPAGVAVIDSQRLYNIISAPDYSPHLLEIRANPGFEIYTFTFG